MPNLHTPERLDGETQVDYRERRVASKRAALALVEPEKHMPKSVQDPDTGKWVFHIPQRIADKARQQWRKAKAIFGARQVRKELKQARATFDQLD